ncbi:hypothetical protein ACMFMG_010369 [Clarireedia jacksonii]
MSVSIVHQGAGGGGDLFANLKFFLVQRMPSRSHYIDLIKSNGGEIAKLEKMADIVIADHARKDAPPGSVSWKFIDESVKAGELKDIEDHCCGAGASASSSRQSRGNQPNKTTRNLFTAQDDHVLTQWVTKAARRGLATKGNDIYTQLEALYPQHTAQSWRDRWVKQLLPRRPQDYPFEEPDDISIPNPHPPNGRGAASILLSRQKVSSSATEPKANQSYSTNSSKKPVSPMKPKDSERGMVFTEEDAAYLRSEFEHILNVSGDKEIDAWATWADTYPGHSAQEWRNYFHEDFKPRELARRKAKAAKKPAPSRQKDRDRSPSRSDLSKKCKDPESMANSKLPQTNKDPDQKQSVARPVTPTQKVEKRTDTSPHTPNDKQYKAEAVDIIKALQLLLHDEDRFETSLRDFIREMESDEDDTDLELFPTICERRVSLFELWRSVMSYGGFEEVNEKALWPTVADRLHYPLAWHARAADALRKCYEEFLFSFEEAVKTQANEPGTVELSTSQEDALLQDQLLGTIQRKAAKSFIDDEATYEDDLDQPTSPIRMSGKRSAGNKKRELYSDDNEPSRKRAKNGKGKAPAVLEIASTPESIINGTHRTPRKYQESPLKNTRVDDQSPDNNSDVEGEELPEFIRPSLLSGRTSAAGPSSSRTEAIKALLEPETQDFHFPDLDTSVMHSSPPARMPKQPSPILDSAPHEESSTQSLPETDENNNSDNNSEEVNAFIDSRVALGYPEDIVTKALTATTMETGDATVVMEMLRNGAPIPDDMAGVWTKEDDEALGDEEGEGFRRVREKHGEWRIEPRRRFLEELREVAEQD